MMAITSHKREILSIGFDKSAKYCVTTGRDNLVIVTELDEYFKSPKTLLIKEIKTFEELTLSSIVIADFPN
jgi:hypothetical protein